MGELPKTMKELVAYGLRDYRLELDYPVPECGPDDNPADTGCASPTPSSDFRAETTGEWRNTSVIPKTR